MTGEGIGSSKEMAWDMDDFEIKIGKVEQPLDLLAVKVLGLTEVCQVLMVSEDLDMEGGSMEIMSSGFQGSDNCKEFTVVDVVVLFSWNK